MTGVISGSGLGFFLEETKHRSSVAGKFGTSPWRRRRIAAAVDKSYNQAHF
ncbi:hypothetical protein ACFS07_03880 [Undibacterium arcticum]